jgi:hypothetical protein
MKKLDQDGLIPLLISILLIVLAIIYLAFTRVQKAQT